MPRVQDLLEPLLRQPALRAAANALASTPAGGNPITLAGLTRTGKALVIAGLAHTFRTPIVVLEPELELAEGLGQAVGVLFEWFEPGASKSVCTLPGYDLAPYEGRSPHAAIMERRSTTLWSIAQGQARVVLAPALVARSRFRDRVYYRSLALTVNAGDEINREDLIEHLARAGYERHEPVDATGSFSVRGGIVDVFPPEAAWPLRIEFLGDVVESLREFNPETQRSRGQAASALLLPLSELQRSPQFFERLLGSLAARSREGLNPTAIGAHPPSWAPEYSAPFPGWEFFAPLADAHSKSLFDLLDHPVVVWDEPADTTRELKAAVAAWDKAYAEVRDMEPPRPRPADLLLSESEFQNSLGALPQLFLKELDVESGDPAPLSGRPIDGEHGGNFSWPMQPAPKFRGAIEPFIESLRAARSAGGRVMVALSTGGKIERLEETLREFEIPFAEPADNSGPARTLPDDRTDEPSNEIPEAVYLVRGALGEGVVIPDCQTTILSESDLFGGFEWGQSARRDKSAVARFISDLSDLKAGDTVVHLDHGIGLYQGLKQLEVNGEVRDFMLITYQDEAKLYVPLERLDLVDKYRSGTGMDGPKPSLDRLGGATWARTKSRVKRALRDMTAELLKLYAERKMSGGAAFSPDTPWQREFDEAFEFDETPDQLKAVDEIKRDLERPEPMDRLLCGDVGYGKTELAMRAAFKVVQDGKQVAVLAPTTVLSFQHFNTFRRRMAGFPVNIELISRFRPPAEQKKIAAATALGKVDILIGTHRMLSKDVAFKDLGLLIVDEEQRFGVAAKEKLKRLRANVDVLTMSATPIPRTLHMSLGGLRDLSVIETPPRGRLAIQTTVAPYSAKLVQAAILNEMERQGQVYYVHNRVEGIFSIAAMIQQLAPTARIGVGHGQMANAELERVMLKFVEGEYDVLVSTSIIENGLDIPRANTIIVHRADRFGLSELYQLRGRVGRSERRAYAYLLIPDEESLTPIARRRLAALKEFSDLGAGFRLAALDLELRGAGNILGGEQSGHLNAIGLDLYLKMLEETTRELKGAPPKPEVRTAMNLGIDIRIPDEYITDEGQRLRMYKRISGVSDPESSAELSSELADRYGSLPGSVEALLDYAVLKNEAEALLIQSIDRKNDEIWIRFNAETPLRPELLTRFVRRRRDAILRPDGALRFRAASAAANPITAVRSALRELQGAH